MNNLTDDTTPAYDIYVEQDRVTFVRRPEQETIVESTPAQEPLRFVPIVMLGFHGLIALLGLALIAYLTLIPTTAEVYALADRVPALAHVHSLPVIDISKSENVNTTGHVHVPATQARGFVTFYNSLTQPQVIDSDMLLIGADGVQVATDQVAYVPAGNLTGNGYVTVWAHALNPGSAGDIKADDIYGLCCKPLIQATNSAFSGGYDARDIQVVAKGDIDNAASNLLIQVQQSLKARLSTMLSPGKMLVTPVPCSAHIASSNPVGAEAKQITVIVTKDCKPQAYNVRELQQALASLIVDKTTTQARAILLRQGIQSVGIQLGWLHDRLPMNVGQIRIILLLRNS